jgi:hypothetical protein
MPESKSHKTAANRIAKQLNAEYNSTDGADIVTPNIAIEIETESTVMSGIRQLQGHKKPAYIAGANKAAVAKALQVTQDTTIGVMDNQGNIIKESTRRKN